MRNVVTREVEDCELREVTHLVRKPEGKVFIASENNEKK